MSREIVTEIVKTKEPKRIITIIFAVLYLFSTFYIFMLEEEYQNNILKYFSLLIHLIGAYFLFGISFIKPKSIGVFKISENSLSFMYDSINKTITTDELNTILLKYTGFGSWWTHSMYGNKNYIDVTTKSNGQYTFEILIKNKEMKNTLKSILNSDVYYDRVKIIKINKTFVEY